MVKRNIVIVSDFLVLFNLFVLFFFLDFSYFSVQIVLFVGSAAEESQASRD